MTYLRIAKTFAFVILSTAKDLKARLTTALMGSSILHSSGQRDASLALSLAAFHSELEHSLSLSHLCGLGDSHVFVSPYHLQVAHPLRLVS